MRVLLVDDEARVREGLGRLFSQLWIHDEDVDLLTADSGSAALEILEVTPVDLVLTDMRMPGMDGADLLRQVHARWPATMRVVLSGYMEEDAAVRSARYAHQFLTKPCPPKAIEEVLNRAFSLTQVLSCDQTRRIVGSLACLPVAPKSYHELRNLLESRDADLRAVSRLVERDPALTAKTLQLVNSAFFSRRVPVSSVADAITRLGVKTLQALVESTALYQAVSEGLTASLVEAAQQRATALADVARQLAGPATFLPAMLCDIGMLVLHAAKVGGDAAAVAVHPRIGACLLILWGFQDDVVQAVLRHHDPPAEGDDDVTTAVSFAARWIDRTVSADEVVARYGRLPTA